MKAVYQTDNDTPTVEKKVVEYTYNGLNQVLTTTDAIGNISYNTYDDIGRLTSFQDAENNTIQYAYDELSRIVKVT